MQSASLSRSAPPPESNLHGRIGFAVGEYAYPGKPPCLREVRLTLEAGKTYGLLGPSGVGKSTLLGLMLRSADKSTVHFEHEGERLSAEMACRGGLIGFMGQHPALLPWLTIAENLQVPAQLNPALRPPETHNVHAAVEAVALAVEDLEKYPHELSFGMKQRAHFLSIICYRPRFLLLDEAFTGLDIATEEKLADFLIDYTRTRPSVTVIVTHNVVTACKRCDTLLFLGTDGRVIELKPDPDAVCQRYRYELERRNVA
jgi:NitT/TauT family transport system ATP-binding protein